MARRIAPNLRNTLADPVEYELRLFYRGHGPEKVGIDGPKHDGDDDRPKLIAGESQHGPVKHDVNYRAVFWLDEHEHAAAEAAAATRRQDAINNAASSKLALTNANDDARVKKDAWDKAKDDLKSARDTLEEKRRLKERAVREHDAAKDQLERARLDLKRGEDKTGMARTAVESAEREVTNTKRALDGAADDFNEAQQKERNAASDEDRTHREYDTAVQGQAQAQQDDTDAQEELTETDPAHIQAERERVANKAFDDAAEADKNAKAAATTQGEADELERKAVRAEKAAADADDEASSAERAAQSETAPKRKKSLTEKAERLRRDATAKEKQATEARRLADEAQTKADEAQDASDTSKAAKTKAMADDEPKPLKAHTEILRADENKKYRVLITDNHGMKMARAKPKDKSEHVDSMKDSKPAQYRLNGWMRDVVPAIPFEAVLRKKSDGKCLAFGASDVRVIWEIIDPPEWRDAPDRFQGPDKPKAWLARLLDTYRAPTVAPDPVSENDNCQAAFGGVRQDNGSVPAPSVLFAAPLTTAAPVALATGPAAALSAVSDVTPAKDPTGQAGVSRVFFRPPPIGGDNYQFRISLIDADDKPVKFRDHKGDLVAYLTTGPMTIWRRVVVDLLVTFDSVKQDTLDWEQVRKSYQCGFTEIIGPILTQSFAKADWEKECKAYFKNKFSSKEVAGKAPFMDPYSTYDHYLLPSYDSLLPILEGGPARVTAAGFALRGRPLLVSTQASYKLTNAEKKLAKEEADASGGTVSEADARKKYLYDYLSDGSSTAKLSAKLDAHWEYIRGIAYRLLDDANKKVGRDNPRKAPQGVLQSDTLPGFAVFFGRTPQQSTTVLGQYFGEREFQFVSRGDVSETFAHEMGHALFLTHSWTKFKDEAGVKFTYLSQDAHQLLDHEQRDSIPCTMAYENRKVYSAAETSVAAAEANPVNWHFCATCLLKLRYWDLVAMRTKSDIRDWIYEGLGPAADKRILLAQPDGNRLPNAAPYQLVPRKGDTWFSIRAQSEHNIAGTTDSAPNNQGYNPVKIITSYTEWVGNKAEHRMLADLRVEKVAGGDDLAKLYTGHHRHVLQTLDLDPPPPAPARKVSIKVTLLADATDPPVPTASGAAMGSTRSVSVDPNPTP